MIKNCTVLTLDLKEQVKELVKENFGVEYNAMPSGLVYYNDGVEMEKFVGNWHIKKNILYVEIENK